MSLPPAAPRVTITSTRRATASASSTPAGPGRLATSRRRRGSRTGVALLAGASVELFAHRPERGAREDRLDRQAEHLAEPEGELEAGVVVAALQVAHGLVVDPDQIGQCLAREASLEPEHGDPVVQARGPAAIGWVLATLLTDHRMYCCISTTVCQVSATVTDRGSVAAHGTRPLGAGSAWREPLNCREAWCGQV